MGSKLTETGIRNKNNLKFQVLFGCFAVPSLFQKEKFDDITHYWYLQCLHKNVKV